MPETENENPDLLKNGETADSTTQTADGAPRRGRPPKSKETSEQITYRPGPEGPATTKWHGVTFHANVPKTVTHAPLIEAAKLNKFFKVGEFTSADAVATNDRAPLPKTAEQYRAHFVGWLTQVSSIAEFDAKWMSEESLRMACGVGSDDLEMMQGLAAPKLADLRKAGMAA
jgi:hypothetical protein